jgi:aryl-alcohol dehydrogenase-like predicted oxidoreductase
MITRRELLGMSVGAGATLALTPDLLCAFQQTGGKLIQRAIPSTGELLPVIGFGARAKEGAEIKAILETLVDHGAKVVDTLHGGPSGEQAAGKAANELGLQKKVFWTTALSVLIPTLPGHEGPPPKVTPADVRAQIDSKLATFNVSRMDLFQLLAHGDIPTHLAVLQEMKKEGRVRYIGVSDLAPPPHVKDAPFYAQLESLMRNEPIDFIGVDYSVGDRRVEEKILPLAQERKIGVMAYFPFDRRRIFQRASDTPLPEWAAEFDATTWAQFFLKYVVSHPAVTVVRTGTTKAAHMLDNIGGGIGRLPNEAMRKRMAELVDALPPTPPAKPQPPSQAPKVSAIALSTAVQDRYVGEYVHAAAGTIVSIRRDGDRLLVKSGSMPEGPLVAHSETRFRAPWGATIEFQLDDKENAIRATVEHGPHLIQLERK